MSILNRDIKINRKYVMIFIVVNFFILAAYYTYGIITVKQLKDDISLISVGNSIVTMNSSDLTDGVVTIPASTSQNISITVTNNAVTTQYYRIVHTGVPTGVAIYETNNDLTSYGEISGSGTLTSAITINNTTSEAVSVTFKCQDSSVYKFDNEMGYSYVNVEMNFDHAGVETPLYDTHSMIPVYYEAINATEGVWKKASKYNSDPSHIWYDYDNYRWANVVTTTSTNRQAYIDASPGTEILFSDINAFFVYIPRFKYYIVSGNGNTSLERQINVVITNTLRGDVNVDGTVSCVDSISNSEDKHLYSEICNDSTYGNIYNNLSTYSHPAFNSELNTYNGFWIGKFVSSNSSSAQIKPNTSHSSLNPFTTSGIRQMTAYNNVYGFNQSEGNNYNNTSWLYTLREGINSHPITSMEWGAVAILASSQYGKSGNPMYSNNTIKGFSRIYNNRSSTYSGRSTNYTTSSTSVNNSSTTVVNYNDLTDVTHTTNEITYPIGYRGAGASTTGTVYGVYDMAGGQYKNVMGVFMNEDGTAPYSMDSQFYTAYSYVPYQGELVDANTASYLEVFKLGDGIKEHVKSYLHNGMWQNGNINFVNSGTMRRGGYYDKNGSIFTVDGVTSTSIYSTYAIITYVLMGE